MNRFNKILFVVTMLIVGGCIAVTDVHTYVFGHSDVTVNELRCEYRVNPLGIDVVEPRLSWTLQSEQRGQEQKAYQVVVASGEKNLQKNQGDLWDSGKVSSDQGAHIVYKGKTLRSRMRCCWKVRVWDKDGKISDWSSPAYWTMGLLQGEDWQAKWVGYDVPAPPSYTQEAAPEQVSLDGCKWVWFPEGDPPRSAPVGTRFLRREINIAAKVKRARLALLADNEAVVSVNDREAGKVSGWNSVQTLDVTDRLKSGKNMIAIAATNAGDTPNPAGLVGKLLVESETGDHMATAIDNSWKVSSIEQEGWRQVDFNDSTWASAREVAEFGAQPWAKAGQDRLVLPSPRYLRKIFWIYSPVKRAVVYASALGLYELHINGQRMGEDYFTPGWTDYSTRVYYQTYEVTDLLRRGSNAIGGILADGWYAGYLGFGRKREHYGKDPRLLVQIEVEYADGTKQTVVTDPSWKAAYGPHLEADFLMGETYDARKEMPGWDRPGFNDSAWGDVAVTENLPSKVQSNPGVTVKRQLQIEPIEITEPKKGAFIFDLGQNFAGWARLKVEGDSGTKVVLRFAEVLNPEGTIYTTNLRAARCTDTYILKGKGTEIWEPRFTYHGFRYVEVTGYPGIPGPDAITGIVVHSDTPVVGSFECSNPMVNKLYSNITWSQRSNFIEVPTDCPQRDERLGWTGDAQIFIRTATYNMDVAAFFTKWLVDLEDAQTPQGAFPDVAPHKVAMGSGVPAWGDAGVICPWTVLEVYADVRVIEKHYESMKKWIAYLKTNSKNLLRPAYGYGDWVAVGSDTPKDVIATAYFAYSTRLVSKMAAVIGRYQDAEQYENLFQQIKDAFNKAYVSDDGKIKGDTQTCYCLALYFDLLDEEKRGQATDHLIEALRRKDWHLSTGFVGLSYLLPTLTQTGHLDIAYQLLNNDTFPSWGYSIKNGATTIWERWDGWTEEKGFQDPGMNSLNHYAFGSVGRWLFGTVAGIDTDVPGYKQIVIRPRPGGGLTYAGATYNSIAGKIESHWKIVRDTFTLEVTVPANTTAAVYVPAKDAETVLESGWPAGAAEGVRFLRMHAGNAIFEVRSGHYRFVSEDPF
jgi:alpha-L-rhamnosidase